MPQSNAQGIDRRPIASRRWPIWQWTVTRLVRMKVTANSISVAGMISGILAGIALACTSILPAGWERLAWILAALFVQLRLLANLLDGMVAIESGQASAVGELYNEIPDRVSDSAILIGAGYALGGDPTLGYLAALAAIFTAYIRAMGKAAGTRQEFCGPMAKPQRMATITVIAVYCAITPGLWQPTWEGRGIMAAGLAIIAVGSAVTAVRRLLRIAAHLRKGKR